MITELRCNKCHRKMKGTTAYDGACACGGVIEAIERPFNSKEKRRRKRERYRAHSLIKKAVEERRARDDTTQNPYA